MLFLLSNCASNLETKPIRKDIIDAVFASGYLVTDDEYQVTARAEGYLNQSLVEEGNEVNQGMPLFLLSSEIPNAELENAQVNYLDAQQKLADTSPQVQQLKSQIAQAKAQYRNDQVNYERYAKLVKTQAVSQVEYERVKLQYENAEQNIAILEKSLADLVDNLELNYQNAQTQLRIQQENKSDYVLSSAIEGQVLQVFKKDGELVRKGEALAQIGGGELLVKLYIAEEDIQKIQLGQMALISLNTNREQLYSAKVSKIYPAFDAQEQSFMVEAKFVELPKNLFANTQLQANIIIAEKKNALLIPTTYVSQEKKVWLSDQKEQKVKTGIRTAEWTEIIEGLSENQSIILKQ